MAMRLVSPNEMHAEGKRIMLEGRDPVTEEDWARLVNFYAVNVHPSVAEVAVPLLCKIMDCPLSDEYVNDIVAFQLNAKNNVEVTLHYTPEDNNAVT